MKTAPAKDAEKSLPLRLESALAPAPAADHDYLQIGEVTELTGLTQRTLRYYEELQLLAPPSRLAGGFRLYSPADVARLQHITRLKHLLGFSLAEIKQIIGAEEDLERWQGAGVPPGNLKHRLEQIDTLITGTATQLERLQSKIAEMDLLRDDLARRLHRLEQKRAALRAEHEGAQFHAASEYS